MFSKPQIEHQWLDKFVGDWTVDSECQMAADQEVEKSKGRMHCRSIGGLWVVMENEGQEPNGNTWSSILTLGYDPQNQRYQGTFIASMMIHLWHYVGVLDPSCTKLILDTEGPKCDQEGLAKYQDIFEIIDTDHWVLSSQILDENGKWHSFMSAHHRRK